MNIWQNVVSTQLILDDSIFSSFHFEACVSDTHYINFKNTLEKHRSILLLENIIFVLSPNWTPSNNALTVFLGDLQNDSKKTYAKVLQYSGVTQANFAKHPAPSETLEDWCYFTI